MSFEELFDLDRLIASSPVVVLWGEPLGKRSVDFVSAGICQFGYTVSEIVMEDVPFDSIVFEADRERVHSAFREALTEGKDSFEMDYRIVTRSGDVRWVEDNVGFYRDERGEAVMYQSSLLDITERKKAGLRLAESDKRLERVLSMAKVGVWEYIPERDEITGVGRASVLGMDEHEIPRSRRELWDRIFSPTEREKHEKAWEDVIEGRSDLFQAELSIVREDGTDLRVLKKGFPVRDEWGGFVKMQGVTVDITALKNTEELALHQSERLSLLHEISLSFMEELDPEILGRKILEKATEFAGAVDGLLSVVEDDPFFRRNMWGVGLYEDLVGRRIPVTEGQMGEVIRTNSRIIVEDYRTYQGRMNLDEYERVTTALSIPLRRGEGLLGVLSISYRDEVMVLEEPLLNLMEQFAATASIALENALLYKRAEIEVREREMTERRLLSHQALVEAAAGVSGYLLSEDSSDERSLSMALHTLGRAVGADRAAILKNMEYVDSSPVACTLVSVELYERGDRSLSNRIQWDGYYNAAFKTLSMNEPFHEVMDSLASGVAFNTPPTVTMIPVFVGRFFWGVLAFAFNRERPPFEIYELDVLRTAAYNVAAAVIRRESERDVNTGYEKLRETFTDVIRTMGQIVGKKDPYTIEHQERVALLALELGRRLGLQEDRCEGLQIAGMVHDIGKIEIPSEILSKPGKLSQIEFELIKTHAESGYDILREVDFPWPVAQIARQHHERLDGSGYPRGLKADEILLEARIIAVADVVESMMSHRPYRPSLGVEVALEEVSSKRGVLYDPDVVDACLELFAERPEFMQGR